MFSNESSILLTVQLIKLKFFKNKELTTINEITDILISKKVKPDSIFLFPWNLLIFSLRALTLFFYFLIFYFIIMFFTENESDSIVFIFKFIFKFILEYKLFPLSCLIIAVISFVLVKISNFFIKKRVLKLQSEYFNTSEYIEKLSDLLEPYQSLGLLKLLNINKSNLFGLVVLQFILVCIELDCIKYSDIYLKPFTFLRKSI